MDLISLDELVGEVPVGAELLAEARQWDESPWLLRRVAARGRLSRLWTSTDYWVPGSGCRIVDRLLAGELDVTPTQRVHAWASSLPETAQAKLRVEYGAHLGRYFELAESCEPDLMDYARGEREFLTFLLVVVCATYPMDERRDEWRRLAYFDDRIGYVDPEG